MFDSRSAGIHKSFVSVLLFLIPTFFMAHGHAAETATRAVATGRISTPGESLTERLSRDLYADFATTFHGPTLNKFGPHSQNGQGFVDPTATSGFDSEMILAHLLSRERMIGVGPSFGFLYQPNIPGREFLLQDAGIKAFYGKTVADEHLRVSTSFYVQFPTSPYAREHGMDFALRATPWLMYDLGTTRWRLGSWSDFKYLSGVSSGLDYKVYVQPYVSYRWTDSFALNLAYETEAQHFLHRPGLEFRNGLANFQPGVIWQVSSTVKVTAYVLVFPNRRLATDSTGVGATLYTRFL